MKKQNKKAAVNYLLTFPIVIYLIIIAGIFFVISGAILTIKSPSIQIPVIKITEPNNLFLKTMQIKSPELEYNSLLLDAIISAEIAEKNRAILQQRKQKETNTEEQERLAKESNSLANKRAILKDSVQNFLKNQNTESDVETCLIILQQPEEINIDSGNKNTEDLAYKIKNGEIKIIPIIEVKRYKENSLFSELPTIKLNLQNSEETQIQIKYYYGECQ